MWHYGPWSQTLDTIVKEEYRVPEEDSELEQIIPVRWTPPQFEPVELKFAAEVEASLLRVLPKFSSMPYNDLLDYVYFETGPMKSVTRGQPLDFTAIPQAQRFVDPTSLLPPKAFYQLRQRFQKLAVPQRKDRPTRVAVDSGFLALLATMDKEGEFEFPEGVILIDEDVGLELRTIRED